MLRSLFIFSFFIIPMFAMAQEQVTFNNVTTMCEAENLKPNQQVQLLGYRIPNDNGGGIFKYDLESVKEPDNGSVFAIKSGIGRLLRVVDPDDDAYAEWFGAYGDGDSIAPHDDQEAINKCLAVYNRVKLLPRVYGVRGKPSEYDETITYHAIDLGPYYKITGSGRDKTTIKLLDGTNPHGNNQGDNYFNLLTNRNFYESAEFVVISDLTLDCNFDAQDRQSTIHAVAIRGGGALVERVNFRRYGTGRDPETGSSRECFVIHQTLVYKDASSCRRAAVYRDLDFTDPGNNGMLEGNVAEITHICLGGASNFENSSWITPKGADLDFDPSNDGENEKNWWPSYGGLVENCVIHDENYDPETQKSPLNGITYGDCIGITIKNNRVENFEGTGVFTMSWWNRNTVITDNKFLNVTTGVALCLMGENAKAIQCPRHENVLIAHNEIVTGNDLHAPWGCTGISLFGGDLPEIIRMKSMHIRENTISGRVFTNAAGQRTCPLGIKIQILRATYTDVRIEDNIIDLPDFAEAVSYIAQEPYSMSMFYYPDVRWVEANKAGNIRFRGNRNKDGKLLYPYLTDWYFTNAPLWGKPVE